MQFTLNEIKKGETQSYKYYILVAIFIIATCFFLTSKLFVKDVTFIKYYQNTIYYSDKIDDEEARNYINNFKESEKLSSITKYTMYIDRNKNKNLMIMITEDTFNFSDNDFSLEQTAANLANDLKKSVEFGKCTKDFKKIKTYEHELMN